MDSFLFICKILMKGVWLVFARFIQIRSKLQKKSPSERVPSIEQYTRTDRKRTESVLHSLSSFLDKHCICRHKCRIKLEVIC